MTNTTINRYLAHIDYPCDGFPISGQKLITPLKSVNSQYSRLLFYSETYSIIGGFTIPGIHIREFNSSFYPHPVSATILNSVSLGLLFSQSN